MRIAATLFMLAAVTAFAQPAQARHHRNHHYARHQHYYKHVATGARAFFSNPAYSDKADADQRYIQASYRERSQPRVRIVSRGHDRGTVIGGRPSGCPHAFCGCEASLYLFHRIIPSLNLALNWVYKFHHTSPAPGMAAARSGHVMVLISYVSGSNWLVHDGNSGHHLTREHVRSIAGYTIVDPHSSKVAMQ